MAHWRAFFTSKDYLTAADLYDEASDRFGEQNALIERVVKVTLKGERGREDQRPGIYFKGHKKPLGANATNCGSISLALGSTDMKQWPGKWVTLYVDENVEVKENGRTVKRPAVRIRMQAPRSQTAERDPRSQPAPNRNAPPPAQQRPQHMARGTQPSSSDRQPPPDLFDKAPPPTDEEAAEILRREREEAARERHR